MYFLVMRKDCTISYIWKRWLQTSSHLCERLKRSHSNDQRNLKTADHKRLHKHFRGLCLPFKTNTMRSSFGSMAIMKKTSRHPDPVLFHNRHSSFLECPLLLFGILALNIVAFCEHFHVWSLMSDLRPKETASISECCGRERSVHRDVLCGLQPDHFFYKLFLLHSRSLIHKLFALLL